MITSLVCTDAPCLLARWVYMSSLFRIHRSSRPKHMLLYLQLAMRHIYIGGERKGHGGLLRSRWAPAQLHQPGLPLEDASPGWHASYTDLSSLAIWTCLVRFAHFLWRSCEPSLTRDLQAHCACCNNHSAKATPCNLFRSFPCCPYITTTKNNTSRLEGVFVGALFLLQRDAEPRKTFGSVVQF